jgi:hypothetical protein
MNKNGLQTSASRAVFRDSNQVISILQCKVSSFGAKSVSLSVKLPDIRTAYRRATGKRLSEQELMRLIVDRLELSILL